MRLKLGRPFLTEFTKRFDVPPADAGTPLMVTWLGVATLLISDGTSALMTDGFFSRTGVEAAGVQGSGAQFSQRPVGERLGEKFASPWARSVSAGRGLARSGQPVKIERPEGKPRFGPPWRAVSSAAGASA